VDRGVSRGQRGGSPPVVNLSFLDRSRYFFFQVAPFQAHCYSENLVALGIEPGASGLAPSFGRTNFGAVIPNLVKYSDKNTCVDLIEEPVVPS
jgi:hypothetical protein